MKKKIVSADLGCNSKSMEVFEQCCQIVIAPLARGDSKCPEGYSESLKMLREILILIASRMLAALGTMNPMDVAEDIVQRWFQNMLFSGFSRYLRHANGRPFAPYGILALRNLCIENARKSRRQRNVNTGSELADKHSGHELSLENSEILAITTKNIERLGPTLRKAFILTVIDKLTNEEAAIKLGILPQLIRVRKCRARKELLRMLSKQMKNFEKI